MRRIKTNREDSIKQDQIVSDSVGIGLTIGLSMGTCVGLMIGSLMGNLALGMTSGMSLGMCLGVAIGYAIGEKKKNQPQPQHIFAKRQPFNKPRR